jgi:Leucine-rich repeat (LRR) protein
MSSIKLNLLFLLLSTLYLTSIDCFTLQCKFDDYMYDKNYRCVVENLNVTSRNEIVSGVSGLHVPRRTNADVIILMIEEQTLHYMPQGLGDFFPNLVYLNVYKSGLKEISKNDLKNFPKLQIFSATNNDIETLPGDLFQFNTKITNISFLRNKIKSIGKNIFVPLSELKDVNLVGNECINGRADKSDQIKKLLNDALDCYH